MVDFSSTSANKAAEPQLQMDTFNRAPLAKSATRKDSYDYI